jgi:hypothetical protein
MMMLKFCFTSTFFIFSFPWFKILCGGRNNPHLQDSAITVITFQLIFPNLKAEKVMLPFCIHDTVGSPVWLSNNFICIFVNRTEKWHERFIKTVTFHSLRCL